MTTTNRETWSVIQDTRLEESSHGRIRRASKDQETWQVLPGSRFEESSHGRIRRVTGTGR